VSHYITDLRKGITLGKEDLYNWGRFEWLL
jgi:hypothetical protein